jgi:hypothetical protein
MQEAGIEVGPLEPEPAASLTNGAANGAALAKTAKTYEDYWTPQQDPVPGGEVVEQYGKIKPLPEHDGTECLKFDNTLWSHGEHFKVRVPLFGNFSAPRVLKIVGRHVDARMHATRVDSLGRGTERVAGKRVKQRRGVWRGVREDDAPAGA